MATLMPLCAGLVGPKSENVEISLVLLLFFERAKGEGTSIFGLARYSDMCQGEDLGGGTEDSSKKKKKKTKRIIK